MSQAERVESNLEALRLLALLGDGPASPAEQEALARYTSWGALPKIFDENITEGLWADQRAELKALLSEEGYAAARRTTINAHYTDRRIGENMWRLVTAAQGEDLDGARVLEPGCGTGNMFQVAPEGLDMVGVELDPTSAAIAQKLLPSAQIRAESFADTSLADLGGPVDVVIGNVPFADVVLHDREHNRAGHTMHNHFIIKSLDMLRPGGTAVLLTSRWTMDAADPSHREDMHHRADLVGAFRLPNSAHTLSAGTDAGTDLLVFTKRPSDAPVPPTPAWVHLDQSADRERPSVSPLFDPEREQPVMNNAAVLGSMRIRKGRFGPEWTVEHRGVDWVAQSLFPVSMMALYEPSFASPIPYRDVADRRSSSAEPAGAEAVEVVAQQQSSRASVSAVAPSDQVRFVGELAVTRDGQDVPVFWQATAERTWEPAEMPKRFSAAAKEELAHLIALKHHHRTVLDLESASSEDTEELSAARAVLADAVEHHHQQWGPINRATVTFRTKNVPMLDELGQEMRDSRGRVRTTKVPDLDADGEQKVTRREPPAMKRFRDDPSSVYVAALEIFNDAEQTARPASICYKRVLSPREPVQKVTSPEDAIAVCMDQHGRLDAEVIGSLLSIDVDQVPDRLGDLAFTDPQTDALVPAGEYLSGNVRAKLRAARKAAADDPVWQRNVAALEPVIPADLGPGEIHPALGAVWIPAQDVQAFAQEMFHDQTQVSVSPVTGRWSVSGGDPWRTWATEQWGTEQAPGHDLLRCALNSTPVKVWVETEPNEPPVLDVPASEAARDKLEELQQRFAEWVWEDPDRAQRLTRVYNDTFNAVVPRREFALGEMQFPGLSSQFAPRPHQSNAVARVIATGGGGVFHPVGFGKTAVMVMATMEQKRLGLVNKPAIVVPNHMLEQFSREFLQMYPHARVLAASSDDLTAEKRRAFVARASTEEWDAIIMTRGAFTKMPVSPATMGAYLGQELEPLREWLTSHKDDADPKTVKQAEKAILKAEEKIKKRLDKATDPGISFEETGIDYLCIDEIHDYKNLMTPSSIQGASIAGSARATDLHQKAWYLRQQHGDRAILGATATPIANSVTEMHTMTRLLNPKVLADTDCEVFDKWARTFGRTITKVELSPAGTLRENTRFAAFQNVPELMVMWAEVGDSLDAETKESLPRPDLQVNAEGERRPQLVTVEASQAQQEFMEELKDRAEQVASRAVQPDEDNMLLISTHGRMAALDLRLIPDGPEPSGEPGKIDAVADKVATIHQDYADQVYLDIDGADHPTPGALQLVFCDMGTPSRSGGDAAERFVVYDELRAALIERGVPRNQIAFMQDAGNDTEKARLFERARTGDVQVLIGSTATMGQGTNVQNRCIALHHVDFTWKPSEMEQREGRIRRQGNQNNQVQIYSYATTHSFDAYMNQTLRRKAGFIEQITSGDIHAREIEDISSETLESFDDIQVALADDPQVAEYTELTVEVGRMRRHRAAHDRAQANLSSQIAQLERSVERLGEQIPQMQHVAGQIVPTTGDRFAVTIRHEDEARTFTDRVAAAEHLHTMIQHVRPFELRSMSLELGGVTWTMGAVLTSSNNGRVSDPMSGNYDLVLEAPRPVGRVTFTPPQMRADPGPSWMTRLETALTKAPDRLAAATALLEERRTELTSAQSRVGAEWPHAAEFEAKSARLTELDRLIKEESTSDKRKDDGPVQVDAAAFPALDSTTSTMTTDTARSPSTSQTTRSSSRTR